MLTHAIYDLATYPEYLEPLRREIMTVLGELGWSANAIKRMRTLDSVLKESLRINCPGCLRLPSQV